MQSTMVLFPEPFGPISPTTVPASTSYDTSFTAIRPRYRFVRLRTWSKGGATVVTAPATAVRPSSGRQPWRAPSGHAATREPPAHAAGKEQHGHDEDGAVEHHPEIGREAQQIGERGEHGARPQHAPEATGPADDHHDQHGLGVVEVEHRWIDDREVEDEQPSDDAGQQR